jgi:hypothetical protein
MRVSLMLLSFMLSVVPHESNPSSKVPCISADEPVYMIERDIRPLSPNRQERKEGPRNSRWNVAGTVDKCRGARLRDASRQCLRSIGRAKNCEVHNGALDVQACYRTRECSGCPIHHAL